MINSDSLRHGFPRPCRIIEPWGVVGRPLINWMREILHAETAEHRESLMEQSVEYDLRPSVKFDDIWAD